MWPLLHQLDAGVGSLRINGTVSLDWLYLVESIAVLILIVFYFFYFPRLLGAVIAFGLRLWLWKSQNVYIEIGAIQWSILGGKIMFCDVRYVSRNMSVRVHRGQQTLLLRPSQASASQGPRHRDSGN